MPDGEIVAVIHADPARADDGLRSLKECYTCGYVMSDGACRVCPPIEVAAPVLDPLEHERRRERMRREDRLAASRPGDRT